MYYVKEIFKSIQGEGFFLVKLQFLLDSLVVIYGMEIKIKEMNQFVVFCDTDFIGINGKNGGKYNLDKLVDKINQVWNLNYSLEKKFVVLTGGEPLLQVDEKLLNKLKNNNFFISLETNGTLKTKLNLDWITVSPKEDSNWILKKGNELKIIFPQPKFDLKKIQNLPFDYFFLQPMHNNLSRINILKTINYCKSHKPWFQVFKFIKSLGIN